MEFPRLFHETCCSVSVSIFAKRILFLFRKILFLYFHSVSVFLRKSVKLSVPFSSIRACDIPMPDEHCPRILHLQISICLPRRHLSFTAIPGSWQTHLENLRQVLMTYSGASLGCYCRGFHRGLS
jgi:hypothetical protein